MPPELSDANVFGTSAQAATLPKEMSDAEVFAPQKELSDEEVFGGPSLMSRVGSAAKSIASSVGTDLAKLTETPESQRLGTAIGEVQAGVSPDVAMERSMAPTAPVPQAPAEPSLGPGGFMRGLVTETTKQNPESAATFLEGFSNDAPEALKAPMMTAAQKIRDFSKDITPEGYQRLQESMYNIRGLADAWNYITETSGSMIGSSIPAALGGIAGRAIGSIAGPAGGKLGEIAGVSMASYVQNYGEVYDALKSAGLDAKTAHDYAKWGTIPIAAMDTGSIEYFLSKFGAGQAAKRAAIDSFVKRVLKEGAKVGGVEAGTEAGQEAVKDALVTVSPADKPFWTLENVKGILESGVAGFIGGAPFGMGAGAVHRAPVAPTEQQIAAAGAGITAEPPVVPTGNLPGPPPGPLPPAPPGPAQGTLPLGPPSAQLGLPLGPPTTPTAQLGARLASIIGEPRPISDSVVEPSLSPVVDRGRSIVDAAASPLIAQGPLETNPQTVSIPKEHISAVAERNAANAAPDERVAVPAIEYKGTLFSGISHADAVEDAEKKLGVPFGDITMSPTFRDGYVTTKGRFIGREEALHIANRHNQYEALYAQEPGTELYSENLKTMEETGAYRKAFEVIDKSQAAQGVKSGLTPDEMAKSFVAKKAAGPFTAQSVAAAQTTLGPKPTYPTSIVAPAPKPPYGQQTQITNALKEAAAKGLPIPSITIGRSVTPPGYPTVNTIHSTTVGQLLPVLPREHFAQGTIARVVTDALIKRLVTIIPTMPIHIVLPGEMNKISGTAEGVFLSSPQSMELPIVHQGPVFVSTYSFTTPNRFTEVVLHEVVHAATSNILRASKAAVELVKLVEAALIKQMPHIPQNLLEMTEQERRQLYIDGKIPYFLINEREFLTGIFTNPDFQALVKDKPAPHDLVKALGLEKEPGKVKKIWDAIIESIRQMLGGLPRSPEVKSLIEAAVRVGADVMKLQTQERQAMQAKFNQVEPMLQAVPRQEETRNAYSMFEGLRDHIEPGERDEMTRQLGYADKMNWFYKRTLHAFQLGELNPLLAPLQRILEKARFADTEEATINDAALRVMKDWVNLGRDMSGKLVGLIDDITNMVYRTQSEIQRGIGRKPTQQEFNTLVRKHQVNPAALDVLTKINALFDKFLDLSSDLAAQEALKITDPVQRAAAVQAVRDNTRNLKSRPYFPFMRYGRHVVLVRNQAGRVIHREHFERRGVYSAAYFQNKAKEQLEKQFPAPQYKVELDILSESSKPMIGMPGMMLDMMAQKLGLTPQQMKALEQLKWELSPAQSYKHRLQHKSYTKGYSQDFQRSFAQYFFHGAKWYVKTKYAADMRAHIQEIRNTANVSLTPQKRLEIANYMEDWLEKGFLNPAQDFIFLKAGLVFYTLAYVPMSAAVNMSQTPMVALPYLGAKFGDARAFAALSKAIGTPKNYFRKGGIAGLTSDAGRALNYGIKTGRLEQTLGVEMASWAQGSNLGVGYGGSAISRALHSIVEKGMWMFSNVEKWNRRTTFAAARELALAQPNNKFVRSILPRYQDEIRKMVAEGFPQHEAEAIVVAGHVVDQTHFMTGPDTRPQIMRGKLGTLLLYQRYTQGLLFLTANNKKDFAPRFMLIALAMAGLGGLPFYKDLAEIARVLAYRFYGKDFNLDREIRRLIKSMGGEDYAADQILHGSSRLGFGVPWLLNALGNTFGQQPGVNQRTGAPSGPDLSGSLGAPAVLPVQLGSLLGPPIQDPDKMFGQQAARAGGVAGQLAFNFYRAIESKDPADFRRWELLMPRFARDLSQVYRAYSTGKLAGKNDTAIIRFDTRDPEHLGELVGMTGGFMPRRLTAKYEELRTQSESIKWYDVNRGMILDQWVAAIRANDPDEKEKVREATREFNTSLPPEARGFALSSQTIMQSIAMRLKSQQMMEAGLAVQKGRIPLIRNIQGMFPESTVDVRKR